MEKGERSVLTVDLIGDPDTASVSTETQKQLSQAGVILNDLFRQLAKLGFKSVSNFRVTLIRAVRRF